MSMSLIYFPLVKIDDIEVFVEPGRLSSDPELYLKEGNKMVEFTVPSLEYEFERGTFFVRTYFFGTYKEFAEKLFAEIAESIEYNYYWPVITLKAQYKQIVLDAIEEKDAAGKYFP